MCFNQNHKGRLRLQHNYEHGVTFQLEVLISLFDDFHVLTTNHNQTHKLIARYGSIHSLSSGRRRDKNLQPGKENGKRKTADSR